MQEIATNRQFQYPRYRIVECIQIAVRFAMNVPQFQYPRYRIVECILPRALRVVLRIGVSISALSDRGMHQPAASSPPTMPPGFNIRAIGSWNASNRGYEDHPVKPLFQYPRYRIVECILCRLPLQFLAVLFQYPRYRIVECIALTIDCFDVATVFQYPRYRIVECIYSTR